MTLKECGRKLSWTDLRYPGNCVEKLSKTTKILSKYNQFPGRDLNPGPPECETGANR
jgi:hypothetical protein